MTTETDEAVYMVRRFCFNEDDPDHRRVIATGLTRDEAREHCQRDDTRGENDYGPWFDGFDVEG